MSTRRKVNSRNPAPGTRPSTNLVIRVAAEVAGISVAEMIDRVSARLDEIEMLNDGESNGTPE